MTGNIAQFPNLRSAGGELTKRFPATSETKNVVVLGIVSAGVPVAVEVAKHLRAPLDLVIIRRLLAPRGPGSQACAVNVAGNLILDEEVEQQHATPPTPFDYFRDDALKSLARRVEVCRGNQAPTKLAGKAILLVDCGIRTGLTMQAAIKAIRTLSPESITAAVPVTSLEGRELVAPLADVFVHLAAPEPFGNAGMWFRDFSRPSDDSFSRLLN